ncbi:alpha-ketoacid dehydrogenase subunit alpha/beta [Motiliproteus sp. MSK22-1]|uniref:dehydrogenase E1 component subunit alpha/beta n=1 Tax=Motiliproteus sp. MSK22-1 TaxID=1897630 RepID=UPI000978A941|nr:alpha-ketoacid dehydrogenase subunit alpha/beta [Motiliproteus sp. MSK22-1]OMH33287.1 MFS transporter [Motiliproteus sp. MSK22-1]
MQNRAEIIHNNFLMRVSDSDLPFSDTAITLKQSGLDQADLVELFESQVLSRQLDFESRRLQALKQGFYTIGSSGHEGNAAIAKAFRFNDMAFLHYRDAAFLIQRSKQLAGQTPIYDMLLSFCASADDPISGGRHKVLGSKALFIPPQTSTIASHLPKAVGAAYSIPLRKRMNLSQDDKIHLANDGVVLSSFGDASANHSTAQGAINCAAWTAYQKVPLPLVFICEDNGIGISTNTPHNWIKANFSNRPGLKYLYCDGLNLLDTYRTAKQAERYARKYRQPVFLHIRTVRLMGHAGSDAQAAYLSREVIEQTEAQDPLLHTARQLIDNHILRSDQICDLYHGIAEQVSRVAKQCILRPKLKTAHQVMQSIVPEKTKSFGRHDLDKCTSNSGLSRKQLFSREKRFMEQPQHLARLLNWALADLMLEQSNIIMAGEDIGPKGGVYNVTSKLSEKFGQHRVINTLLDEQSILGLAIGLAHNGFLPIPEIQFLAYVHNAEDQIRGEAASLSFFSNGQYSNPMIIRIAGLAYQKGFGGHFHNDNSFAVFRDIPGVILACPSNGADAVEMMRESVRLAQEERRIVIFLEPIALYMTRDLHEEGDGLWTSTYRAPDEAQPIALGELNQYGKGTELAILTYGNGYYLSRQAAKELEVQNIQLRVIDLRWLAPLNKEAIMKSVADCSHILIVDECRQTGSISEALMTLLLEELSKASTEQNANKKPLINRLTATDSFIPLGPAATATLPKKDDIIKAALRLLNKHTPAPRVEPVA